MALQLGHRISYDLDFFTREVFDENKLLPQLKEISKFHLERTAWRTILGKFSGVKFSLFFYEYPLIDPPKRFGKINVLGISDIAAMKIAAIASRGVKRDFVDMYFICKEGVSLKEAVQLYDRKYKNLATTSLHIMKSLVYFDDADPEEMPKMLKPCEWKAVKKYFETEIKKMNKI